MELESVITELERNRKVFKETLADMPKPLIHWKAKPKDWSLLEIICHLVDEEKEDFRARTEHALRQPGTPLKPIDPAGWVKSRNYSEQDFEKKVEQFNKERQISLAWLKTTADLKWDNSALHPEYGAMPAHSFFHNWLAHDYHHIRQINRIKYNFLKQNSGDSLEYAGNW
ncbi:DinB family protein [Muricauda sp. CAU 1633]|uniref:DinB family protein n=1 Tax=Allomuricauda sp. CAU 1633 TaxID=2816036 RepID=UPI001A8F8A71|nr:DinB family protein [Muricauda sp. CAU 1633]MBO0322543.1 DinB family protein [Muricauda sp. CAU 1633]